jgi:hypothetical protein
MGVGVPPGSDPAETHLRFPLEDIVIVLIFLGDRKPVTTSQRRSIRVGKKTAEKYEMGTRRRTHSGRPRAHLLDLEVHPRPP